MNTVRRDQGNLTGRDPGEAAGGYGAVSGFATRRGS